MNWGRSGASHHHAIFFSSNLENPLLEKLEKLMFDITGVAPVPQGDSHFADQTWPVFDLSEEKKTGVGANLSAIEIGLDFLVRNTLKKEQLCSTTFHGCFLFFLVITQ